MCIPHTNLLCDIMLDSIVVLCCLAYSFLTVHPSVECVAMMLNAALLA